MATEAISNPIGDSLNVNRPLRVVPVIPAVPRKFERKPTPTIGPGEQTRPVSQASSKKDCFSLEDLDGSPVKSESLNDHITESEGDLDKSKVEGWHSKTAFIPGMGKTFNVYTDAIPYSQDFGLEKYGHKLPPPFYPSKYNIFSPFDLLPQLDTSQGQAHDSLANNNTDHQTDQYAPVCSSNLQSNPTPPADILPSPTESLYQGYGHFPGRSPHHQPTPPINTILSPPEVTYEDYSQTLPTPCTTPQNLLLDSTAVLQYSFYQGYSYGNLQPVFSPLTRSASPQHSSPRIGHDFDLPAGDERKSYSCVSDQREGELGSIAGSAPLSIITHNTVVQSRDSPYGSVHVGDSAGESGLTSEFSFRHLASSQSSLGLENDTQQQIESETQSDKNAPARPVEYEAWRSSILESLNATLNVSLNQCSLTDHLLQQFDSGTFSDCHLELSYEDDKFETVEFLLHCAVITQSPLLKTSLNATTVQEDGTRQLQIQIHDRFITPVAIRAALRVCYGESPLLFNGTSRARFSQSTAEISNSWMENALAFAKAGSLLGLEAVTYRGLQIASKVLNWENLETALSFLLCGGMNAGCGLENDIQSDSFVYATNKLVDPKSANTRGPEEDSVSANVEKSAEPEARTTDNSQKFHSPSMIDMLYQCLHFMIADFPEAWNLDVSCRPSADIDRLPTIPENRSPLSKSRLSLIQFGDHPSERTTKASDENTVLSSIMVSMPYVFIKYVVDRLSGSTRNKNLRKLVKEREWRRRRVLKSNSIPFSTRQAAVEYGHAGWEEYVDEDQNSQLSIERKWVGLEGHSIVKTGEF